MMMTSPIASTMARENSRAHVFIDESKARRYIVVAATVAHRDVGEARRHVSSLRHKGSPSIHMRKESERTKRRIVDGLVDYRFSATVVVSDQGNELARRMACLATVFRDCAAKNAARLVI